MRKNNKLFPCIFMNIFIHPFRPDFESNLGKFSNFHLTLSEPKDLSHTWAECARERERGRFGTETESGIELGLGLGLGTPQRVPSFPFCFDYELKYSENSFAPSALSYNKFLVQDKILIFMWKTTCNLLCQHWLSLYERVCVCECVCRARRPAKGACLGSSWDSISQIYCL